MARLGVPVISAVIGEGGSGGALAIGVCDRLLMLQYSVYSVISPEGCASILWKSADKKELAAEAMGITADRIAKLGLVDEVLREPLGGAHRDPQTMAEDLKAALLRHLRRFGGAGHRGPARDAACTPARAGRLPVGRMSCLRARTREACAVQPAGSASETFEPALVAGRIDGLLRGLARPATGLCVAYSGGLDSTVLLHALAMLPDPASRPRLRAVHVDHGLNPQSPHWSRHCASVAAALAIDCRRLTVDARAPRGASPEAWARTARRAAIAAELASGEVLLTAHHADDQLETVLLQLLRGGGPAGIAGMPRLAPFGRGWQARPLLDFTRDSLHRLGNRHRARLGRGSNESRSAVRSQLPASLRCCPPCVRAGRRRRARSARLRS